MFITTEHALSTEIYFHCLIKMLQSRQSFLLFKDFSGHKNLPFWNWKQLQIWAFLYLFNKKQVPKQCRFCYNELCLMLSGISPQTKKKRGRWNFGKRNTERVINYSVQIHLHINKFFFLYPKLAWGIKTWGSYKKIAKVRENYSPFIIIRFLWNKTVFNFTNCFFWK